MQYFNPDMFDFGKVFDSIKHFYPIGVKKNESRLDFSYPGFKELESIIIDNIHSVKHFEDRWSVFIREIEAEFNKETIGTTYGQAPSFSAFVLLEKSTFDNLTRTKEVHFFVSLVGPYYTIIGLDSNTVKIEEKNYRSTNYLVVSPENEFAQIFRLLCDKIETRFEGFRFIPIDLCRQVIDGLNVRYSAENLNTVFHALFNDHIDLAVNSTIGNEYYKSEDWIKEGSVDISGGWTAYPPIG
ncbi:hypothetical protein A4D02_26220 [Niastella koreensis]|uniref:Uncharacterized protein n=2 Tax=Niastella koreensis TaxID=354356 RepID=G8TKU0_NIAKG|nr:hypothetical protein [Niastella koreensis]AEV99769.1 hypothetical protein Niako_3465 [Niastella koreensis GR20-10]OQP51611.1 hypothetical protein A4D02_26220 [Niastella koreensis]